MGDEEGDEGGEQVARGVGRCRKVRAERSRLLLVEGKEGRGGDELDCLLVVELDLNLVGPTLRLVDWLSD